jgi:hypothetical protein
MGINKTCIMHSQLLDARLAAAEANGGAALASLDSQLAEVEDVISYVSDVLSLGAQQLSMDDGSACCNAVGLKAQVTRRLHVATAACLTYTDTGTGQRHACRK